MKKIIFIFIIFMSNPSRIVSQNLSIDFKILIIPQTTSDSVNLEIVIKNLNKKPIKIALDFVSVTIEKDNAKNINNCIYKNNKEIHYHASPRIKYSKIRGAKQLIITKSIKLNEICWTNTINEVGLYTLQVKYYEQKLNKSFESNIKRIEIN